MEWNAEEALPLRSKLTGREEGRDSMLKAKLGLYQADDQKFRRNFQGQRFKMVNRQ